MRHRKRIKKLGVSKPRRTQMMRNMTASLILSERLQTTEARAKALSAHFARLMHHVQTKNIREAIRITPKYLYGASASRKLHAEFKTRFEKRTSGFTRITHIGPRGGDNARLVSIELV